jgi:hypothetical protein
VIVYFVEIVQELCGDEEKKKKGRSAEEGLTDFFTAMDPEARE